MSVFALCLEAFVVSAPICELSASLAEVLTLFKQGGCDRIVIVDERHHPLGVLPLLAVAPYLSTSPEQATDCLSLNWQQSLAHAARDLIQPLTPLPASFSLAQFLPHLQQSQQRKDALMVGEGVDFPFYGLVDRTGKFVGLLDQLRLLQFLATHPVTSSTASQPFSKQASACDSDPDSQPSIAPLIHFLERLPIPLMLQTSMGQFLTQNLAWREQIGELKTPGWIRREAAALLESPVLQQSSALSTASTHSRSWDARSHSIEGYAGPHCLLADPLTDPTVSPMETGLDDSGSSPSLSQACQLGSRPDTCVCICPMKNGQERVWQFIKIPLGVISPQMELNLADKWLHWENSVQERAAQVFRLATLDVDVESSLNARQTLESLALSPEETLWLVLAQDVTEQQQVAKELAAKNADLVQLNRLKDEFLACITHELKTPLTAVLGLSGLLKEQVLGKLNERQARYINLIHQSGRNLMSVVNDILDLTRMETGQLNLTLRSVNIAKVCDRAFHLAQQLPHLKPKPEDVEIDDSASEIRFTLEIEPGLEHIIADELRLRQMLAHLLANALKFTQPGDAMGLQVSRWEGWIAFTVWDNGIGIPAEKQHLIFQKFQQLENPLTRQFEGTGLGLVLTQRLARLHGGDVSFISKEGEGSQFTLLLPPSPPHNARTHKDDDPILSAPPIPLPSLPQQNRLVLIVEAVPQFIEDLAGQLTGLGYRVAIARSGTEALEKARRLQPCSIFLNPLLPLLGGWDVLTLLKSDRATRHIPAIVTATQAEKEKAYQNRADSFLSLPIQSNILQQVLGRLTAQPATADPESCFSNSLTILYLSACDQTQTASVNTAQTKVIRSTSEGDGQPATFLPISYTAWVEWEATRTQDLRPQDLLLNSPERQPIVDLSSLLHLYRYRVLEADDLEQAELLARVWQLDVVLLECKLPEPKAYLHQLSQYPGLVSLPIVTLDPATTQVANQVEGLSVYPCFATTKTLDTGALLKAIQVAAGIGWKPTILVLDIARLPDLAKPESGLRSGDAEFGTWVQALIQYIQTAGFRGLMGHSWAETLQQIQYCSIDLLLICLSDVQPHPDLERALRVLEQLPMKPPTLLLDHRWDLDRGATKGPAPIDNRHKMSKSPPSAVPSKQHAENSENEAFEALLQTVATQVLPASLPMEQLLVRVRQTLNLQP